MLKKTIAVLLIVVLAVIVAFPRVTSADRDGQGVQSQGHQSGDHDDNDHQGTETQTGDHDHQENQTEVEKIKFDIPLRGSEQVGPVNTTAFGGAEAQLSENETSLTFELQVCDIANVTAAHIHVGNSTTNGPIILFLFKAGETTFSSTDGCSELSEGVLTPTNLINNAGAGINNWTDFVNALRSGNTYINVHTTAHPMGEIRGQLASEHEHEDEHEGDE